MLLWTPLCSRLSGAVPAPQRRRLRAPDSHYLCNARPWLRQGLGCHDKLFTRPPRADPRVHLCTFSHSRAARGLGVPSHTLRKTPPPPGTVRGGQLGWPPCPRHGRGFRRATCGPLLRVAGNASSLESLPRRSVRKRRSAPFVRLCSTWLSAIVHSAALVPRVSVVIRVR